MYNAHRGIPPGPPPQPQSRVAELLDHVRAEFDAQIGRTTDTEHHRKRNWQRLGSLEMDAHGVGGPTKVPMRQT